jgi:nucleoside-diphosphate-sugar epimerase
MQATVPQRVVILGASGFVGSHLKRHLEAADISCLALSSRDIDLCDAASVDSLTSSWTADDAVVFVSAITPDRGKDVRTLMKNLSMAEHLSAALARSRCGHLVYISSDAVYADDLNPVREEAAPNPASFHGLMHLARERILAPAARQAQVPSLILRLSLLYGPGDTHNSYGPNRFMRTARGDRRIELFGRGEELRDHVFIDDVCRAIGLCLQHQSEGLVNLASGVSTSFGLVAQVIAAASDHPVEIICRDRSSPITHRHFDITEFCQAFPGFQFTMLAEGLAHTLQVTKLAASRRAA